MPHTRLLLTRKINLSITISFTEFYKVRYYYSSTSLTLDVYGNTIKIHKAMSVCFIATNVIILKHGMKRMSEASTNLLNKNRQLLFAGNIERILSIYEKKINSEADYIDRLTASYQVPSENMTTQNIIYSLSPKFSTKKANIISSYKPYLSPKITVDSVSDKGNVSFITEVTTASRYVNTSDLIQKVNMNAENTSIVTTTGSGSNIYSDLTINYL